MNLSLTTHSLIARSRFRNISFPVQAYSELCQNRSIMMQVYLPEATRANDYYQPLHQINIV